MSRRWGSEKPTPTPLNGEAQKPTRSAKKKWKERKSIRKGQKKRQGKPRPYHLNGGTRRESVDRKAKTELAPQLWRGGVRRTYSTYYEKTKVTQSYATGGSVQINPAPREGVGRTKYNRAQKTDSPVPQFGGPITRQRPATKPGGVGWTE